MSCLPLGTSSLLLSLNKEPLRFTVPLVLKGLQNLVDPAVSQNGARPLCVSAEQLAVVHIKFQMW